MTKKNIIYTPTLMEKLLGKNYKWWYLALNSFKSTTIYRVSTIFYGLQHLLYVAGILLVWYVNYQNGADKFNFNQIFTYFTVGIFFNSLISFHVGWEFSQDIKSGQISEKLLYPASVFRQYLFKNIGGKMFFNLDLLFWIFILLAGYKFLILPTVWNFLVVIILGLCAILINYTTSFLIGCLAFFFVDSYGISSFIEEIKFIASGRVIPLDLFWLTNFLSFTPFAYLLHHPMQIYLGKYNPKETILVFFGGIFWCVVLYFLAKWVFKIGLKRNESVGL